MHSCDAGHVSIRATRAGRDSTPTARGHEGNGFYPRDPCGPRPLRPLAVLTSGVFLSARPVRAATVFFISVPHDVCVSIRATRAGRDPLLCRIGSELE